MRRTDVRETNFLRQPGDPLFVCRVAIRVQQANRKRLDAGIAERLELLPHVGFARNGENLTGVGHALVDFDYRRAKRRRLADRQIEQSRPGLIADLQHVAEAPRGYERGAGTASRNQCVGAARRAEAEDHRRHGLRERDAQQVADGDERGVERGAEFVARAGGRGTGESAKSQAAGGMVEGDHLTRLERCAIFIDQDELPTGPEFRGVVAAGRVENRVTCGTRFDAPLRDAAGEQLEPLQAAVRRTGQRVGERAADVDPKFPAGVCHGASVQLGGVP